MSNSSIIKVILENIKNNENDINLLKNNHIINDLMTTDNNQYTIFEYQYTNYKILNIKYCIIGYCDNDVVMYEGNLILKNLTNVLIYPPFMRSYYKDENLNLCDIIITLQETKIKILICGMIDKNIIWKSNISILTI